MSKTEVKFEGCVITNKVGTRSLSPNGFEDLYAQAVAVSQKSKHASCYEWMRELKIGYAEAVILMDGMEARGFVRPSKMNGDIPESGPRKLK